MPLDGTNIRIQIPKAHLFLINEPAFIKGLWGGRGGAKSWSAATAISALAAQRKMRILCGREFQTSIKDSVHYLICSRIQEMGLSHLYDMQDKQIKGHLGSEIFYRGFARNLQEIKSTEALDLCWLEEAEATSEQSWETLLPTMRKAGAEIWATWNPVDEKAPTRQRLIVKPYPGSIVKKVGWQDNPFFPDELEKQRQIMLADRDDWEAYDHVWEGACRRITGATIFRGKFELAAFETPSWARFFHGADWGFAVDPTTLIRSFMGPPIEHLHNPEMRNDESCLYIDRELYQVGLELDHIPDFFRQIPTSPNWPIYADSARPETISYVARQGGFNISPADKWEGCVEDGIQHLKGFARIYIHQSCTHMYEEARLYSFKVDKQTEEVLPIVVDKHNHCWDALRYSIGDFIQRRGELAIWAKLSKRRLQLPTR
jgi:phage terminase large subunit